jgi:small subunit ribosomal protein S6
LVAERTREYELVMVLSPEAAAEEVAAAVERVTGVIAETGGEVSDHEIWGLRRLAYPINRFQEGHYVLAHFSLDATHLRELERTLTASEDVLRHLITKVDKRSKPAPAPEAQAAQAPQETPSSGGPG